MNLNTPQLFQTQNVAGTPAQSHTELWLSSMHLNFHILHINERTSKFFIFTICFKMSTVFWFMGPEYAIDFQSDFWNSYFCFQLSLEYFQTKSNSIKLVSLFFNTYLCNFLFTIFYCPDLLKFRYSTYRIKKTVKNVLHTLYITHHCSLCDGMLNTNRGVYDYWKCKVTGSCPLFKKGW